MSLTEKLAQVIKLEVGSDGTDIVFVGDTHFSYISPRSRIDDYPETCVKKLDTLRNMCKQRGFKYIVFLGDIFHKPKQPVDYIYKIMVAFKRFKEDGITCFSITGNHDIFNERLDSLEKTSLGILYETGLLTPFSLVSLKTTSGTVNVYGYHYSEQPIALMSKDTQENPIGDYNVLTAHMFYEFGLSTGTDNLKESDITNLGYDMYVLGHDHMMYQETWVGNKVVVRPGSFMRGTGHKYNMTRDVYVDILRFKEGKAVVERVTLDVQSAEMVFSASATDKVDLKTLTDDLKSQFNSLITMLESPKTEGVTVYKVMDDMVIQPKVKVRIEQYLTDFGLFRPSVNE